jgi:hypothetical protein
VQLPPFSSNAGLDGVQPLRRREALKDDSLDGVLVTNDHVIAGAADLFAQTSAGFSICRTIVEAHAGRLTVDSNPDRGATVGFTLPVNDQDGQQIRVSGSSSSLVHGPR